MTALPLCVRIDVRDRRSFEALSRDGWREIGVLDTYEGVVRARSSLDIVRNHPSLAEVYRRPFISRLPNLGFSGRLWRDPEIPREVAIEETTRFILNAEMFYFVGNSFAIFSRRGDTLILDLIACAPSGRGTACDLIQNAVANNCLAKFRVGTYSDNIAARGLYESLGLARVRSDRVFHK